MDEREVSYRAAAAKFWGPAGAYAYDAYARLRLALYPELPGQVPIVIGITAYGHVSGLTRSEWEHGPRITLPPEIFQGTTAIDAKREVRGGRRRVDDTLTHEMLHVWLAVTGRETRHDSADWYEAVRRLSPAVLGREADIDARPGPRRKSVRKPNPAYEPGTGKPKTIVGKEADPEAISRHAAIAAWPYSFRPRDYDWGQPIPCPSY